MSFRWRDWLPNRWSIVIGRRTRAHRLPSSEGDSTEVIRLASLLRGSTDSRSSLALCCDGDFLWDGRRERSLTEYWNNRRRFPEALFVSARRLLASPYTKIETIEAERREGQQVFSGI